MAKPVAEIVVFVTTPSEEEATRISRSLVEAGLVACANVLPKVRSIFRWEGKVTEEQESLIVLKTRSGLMKQLEKAIGDEDFEQAAVLRDDIRQTREKFDGLTTS